MPWFSQKLKFIWSYSGSYTSEVQQTDLPLSFARLKMYLIQPRTAIFTLELKQEPPNIQLNLEHTAYQWIEISKISSLKPVLITQFIEGLLKTNISVIAHLSH